MRLSVKAANTNEEDMRKEAAGRSQPRGRIKAPKEHDEAYYLCVSRVVDRRFIFGDAEKEIFVQMMRKHERFYGVRVMTCCVMSNHCHILVEVPKCPEVMPSDEEIAKICVDLLFRREKGMPGASPAT